MTRTRRLAATAVAASLTLLVGVAPVAASGAASPRTAPITAGQLPQLPAARQAAEWLAGQFTAQGFIPTSPGSNQAEPLRHRPESVGAVGGRRRPSLAQTALGYLQSNVDAYVDGGRSRRSRSTGAAHPRRGVTGSGPHSFGGTDLVARLLATEQTSGPDAGLFGTETQAADYSAGGYQQGLALAALAAAGVRNTSQLSSAISWLVAEQCPDGGWTTPDNANNPCTGVPADFSGPDTNSTALALDGLAAQGAVNPCGLGRRPGLPRLRTGC